MGIWMPTSYWYREAMAVDRRVNEYDERLHFGQNQQNGQWVIFMEMYGEQIPVLGFPHLPSPDEALRRLYKTDARRHGEKILNDLNRHNEAIKKQFDVKAKEASDELAEAFDWSYRKEGIHPNPRVFVKGMSANEPTGRGKAASSTEASS